jgi:hypothetical protein
MLGAMADQLTCGFCKQPLPDNRPGRTTRNLAGTSVIVLFCPNCGAVLGGASKSG